MRVLAAKIAATAALAAALFLGTEAVAQAATTTAAEAPITATTNNSSNPWD